MSIIGNALAGGVADGMRVVGQQMVAREQADAARDQLAMKLKAERDDLLTRLAAAAKEGKLNRDAGLEKARLQHGSRFEARPDLYGADASPTDRKKFERTKTSTRITDDGDPYNPNVDVSTENVFDEDGYRKAEDARVQRNINRRVQVDMPDKYDDQQKGRSREIANTVMAQNPSGDDAAAAMLTAEAKDRYKMSTGGNAIIDVVRGASTTTDIGKSVITKNERPPVGRSGGGGRGSGSVDAANLRALVTSLRTQSSNISKNISKLQEGIPTPQKRADIQAAQAQLEAINKRLQEAESRLGGSASQGDNAIPAPASKAEYDKLPKGAKYRDPQGVVRTKG